MEYGAVIAWWILFQALAIAGLPIAAILLPRFEDRGAGVALPIAIVLLTIPAYWIGHFTFGPVAVAGGIAILATAAVWAAWRGPEVASRRYAEVAVVFTLAFGLLVAVRAVDPGIHPAGGEKFLDFGLLRSLLRSPRLPPSDMWFAGEPVQYYYGGHLMTALLTELTATPPKYAYNLALAGFYATLVAAAYGLAGSIAAARGASYRVAGALGAFLVGFASNLHTPLRVLLWALPDGMSRPIAVMVAETVNSDPEQLSTIDGFFYWTASRVIPGTINEFPLFAWINGDLHAHMLSTPLLLTVVALGVAYFQAPTNERSRRRVLVFGAIPPIAGLIAVVNTWSLPTAIGVAWLAVLFAPAEPATMLPRRVVDRLPDLDGMRAEFARLAAATGTAAVVAILSVVWVLPFFLGPASGRGIGVLPDRSDLVPFFLVHGTVLIVFWLFLGRRARSALTAVDETRRLALIAVGVGVVVAGLIADAAAVALVVPPLAVAWILLRWDGESGERSVGFETVLFIAGAGLVLLVEFAFVKEQAGPGRLNTVFKTYMQVWVLWAVATGAALARLYRERSGRRTETGVDGTTGPRTADRNRHGRAIAALIAIVVVSTALYGTFALTAHFDGARDPTLDATQYAATYHGPQWEAIQRLDAQPGQPHIVTAPGCYCHRVETVYPYEWVNAPSSFTGIPTVAGWQHEIGYRDRETYMQRVAHVEAIYTGPWDRRVELLHEYDVRYIYVGPNERALYDDPGFDGREGLSIFFQNDAVTIYEVHHDRL